MRYYILIYGLFLITSCDSSEKETLVEVKEELIMAPRSEMALLMNEMYAFNESIKQQIISGSINNAYPTHFEKINSAILTNPSDRDTSFETFSQEFIHKTKAVFDSSDGDASLKYNEAVNACIACHQTTCIGPIPRIKKLLIN